jgi:hypothetical protein
MRMIVAFLLLAAPELAIAEVSDKAPHELELVAVAVVCAAVSFVAARRKWWLAVIGALLSVVAVTIASDFLEIRAALWNERGLIYFVALGAFVAAAPASTVLGIVRGLRRHDV